MALGWLCVISRSKNTNFRKISKQCPRETDGKLLRYPCNFMMLSYVMVTMWAVSMHLSGALHTFSNPASIWIRYMNPPVKFVPVQKKRKPPDLVNKKFSTVHHYWPRFQQSMVVDPVRHLPDVPDFSWGQNCLHYTGLPSFRKESAADWPNFGQTVPVCSTCHGKTTSCPEVNTSSLHFPKLDSLTELNSSDILSQHPKAFLGDSEVFALLVDSGASCCVSHKMSDFVTKLRKFEHPRVLGGLANGIAIEGVGQVEWTVKTDAGTFRTVNVEACYVPQAGRRILSPQSCDQQNSGTAMSFSIDGAKGKLKFKDNGEIVICPLDKRTNLPLIETMSGNIERLRTTELNMCITDEANQNLSAAQKELLRWHFKLGHLSFSSIQLLLRSNALGNGRLQTSAANCPHPKCSSCQYGKAKRRPTGATETKPIFEKEGVLKKEDLFPGQRVSIDHFICTKKGRLYESKGQSKETEMYAGGMIFVDHASGFIHIEFVATLTASETIAAKHRYERAMLSQGVTVASYQADNGTFSAAAFVKELHERYQEVGYSGVGAAHQNGVAERNIGTIMSMARTMMLHSAVRWPETADSSLWPMAVDYAVYLFNHVPNPVTGISPVELSTRTALQHKDYHHLHVWGCPAYVLDPTLQGGKKLPKWQPRSRRAVFLGLSKKHAASIPLVLNLNSLCISPQFHVIFDDWFTTVASSLETEESPDWWDDLFDSKFQYHFDDDDPIKLSAEWMDEQELAYIKFEEERKRVLPPPELASEGAILPATTPLFGKENEILPQFLPPQPNYRPEQPNFAAPELPPTPIRTILPSPPTPLPTGATFRVPPQQFAPPPTVQKLKLPIEATRHSTRIQARRDAQIEFNSASCPANIEYVVNCCAFISAMPELAARDSAYQDLLRFDPDNGETDPSPKAYVASSSSDPDTLRYHEARMDIDWPGFRDAMKIEIDALQKMSTWTLVKRDLSKNILQGTWAFKRKRYPDGRVRKLKARFCVRGDQQIEGVDFFESFAPVVQWSTVRLILILVLKFGLETRQVDFNNAFAQADCKEEVYVECPKGFESSEGNDVVMKLNKSLYGLRQAPKTFYDHMVAGLVAQGFRVSKHDPCLYIHPDMLAISWVDDVVFVSRDGKKIEAMIQRLKDAGYDLDTEGEISAFLGIQIDKLDESFSLTQTGLIGKIIKFTHLEDCNLDRTPASTTALGSDVQGEPWVDGKEDFEYAAAVGMLLYLANNTRPDIAFAVHQCARFTHSPRQSHAKAVKRIVRYLQGTKDKGLIFTPTDELVVDCYVDADFAGLWKSEDDQDPVCVKSRTGYVLEFAGCPLTWTSKLQTEIALSTMESEYIALSQAMRELIPTRRIVDEVTSCFSLGGTEGPARCRTFSKVYEDNSAALLMANVPRITLRNRHFAVKYHFFREHIRLGEIEMVKVESENQKADCLTKGLVAEIFVKVRKLLLGW